MSKVKSVPHDHRTARGARGSSGTDVTGGMALRLAAAGWFARVGIESILLDGRKAGALAAALAGRRGGGTRVRGLA